MTTFPSREQMVLHLKHTVKIAARAKSFGRHPFGSILVGPDNKTVLLEQGNIDTLHHAESTLCHVACMYLNYKEKKTNNLFVLPRDQLFTRVFGSLYFIY